ncbi:MAG: hypothetical protein KDK27_09100, partial [Leptospiraceae bacterium]|nr:hypothetical protein [Leptospiraceae bacterium]
MDRLHDTEQNLLRLGDILKSKREEMEHLERQARKTRQYIKLKEELDNHDRRLRYLTYGQLNERSQKAEEKLQALMKKRDASMERVRSGEERIGQVETGIQDLMEEMHRIDRAFHQDLSSLESMNAGLERVDVDRRDRKEKAGDLKKRFEEESRNRKELEKKYQESLQLELNLKSDIETMNERNEKINEVMQNLRKQIRFTIDKEEANQKSIQEGEDNQARLLEDLKNVTQDLILELERKKRELESREDYRTSLKENIMQHLLDGSDAAGEMETLLKQNDVSGLKKLLARIKFEEIIQDFERYESIEQEFRSLLFDRSGLLARKETLDREMSNIIVRKDELQKENHQLANQRKDYLAKLDTEKNRKVELDLQIRDYEVRRESSQEAREGLQKQLEQAVNRFNYYEDQMRQIANEQLKLEAEEKELRERIQEVQQRTRKQSGTIEDLKKKIDKQRGEIEQLRVRVRRDQEEAERILPEISQQERSAEQIRVAISSLEEELYNDFQISIGELEEECHKLKLRKDHEESRCRQLQQEIKDLGAFNALAIEELERARESFEELEKQRQDIEAARKNILGILKDIDEKSRQMFQDTFERVQVNFAEIFQTLFGGGHARLSLTDDGDALNSGVDIMVQPPGKKNSSISLLSGGEQSMTAIALMFAIYLVRPSPFCFLDEIDAPLDDNNVNRFLRMLSRFTPRTQFLVISHNKLTMSHAAAIFGVTQEEAGVSKLVSVRLKEEAVVS